MRIIRLLIAAVVTILLIFVLDTRIGTLPPLGKFLNPFSGFWQNAEPIGKKYQGEINITGIKEEVTILYDDANVPHIFAKNDNDLYFLQGYVTARDRLWQMEIQTHAAAGRVSEILGEGLVNFDRETRRTGLVNSARETLEYLKQDPEVYTALHAYSAGVNAWIDQLEPRNLPIEYKLLDYEPEHWSPFKSVLLLKYMSQMLTGKEFDAAYTKVLSIYGKDIVDLLYPDNIGNAAPIVTDMKVQNEVSKIDTPSLAAAPEFYPALTYNDPHPDNGSNNWAVGGSKTATGKPLLANDPHLGLNLPSLWYMVQLNAPGVNVFGASLPGGPFVVIGFNEEIAWGVTNAQRDVKDWYKINFKDKNKTSYHYGNELRQTKSVIEEIKVRGGATIYDTVVYTHFGPVVFDDRFPGDSSAIDLSLKWIAHEVSNEFRALYLLNRGRNYDDYSEAIKYFSCPGQNFVFASKEGDIAIWQQGKFPARWPEQGKFIMDGSLAEYDWQGYIPQEHNPHMKNPERGFVSSANQHPTDSTYPYYYQGNFEYYRNRRINDILSAKDNHTFSDMMALQNDNYNLKAAEGLPILLKHLDRSRLTEEEEEHLKVLQQWDFYSESDAIAPALFENWLDTLMALTFDEFRNDKSFNMPKQYVFLNLIKDQPQHTFFDMEGTAEVESAADLVQRSFSAMTAHFNDWENRTGRPLNWMNYKRTHLTHLARTLKPFDVDYVPIGGNSSIVNATSATHGASFRLIVSLEDTIKAWAIYPGGQSGNPGSQLYNDYVADWAAGKYISVVFLKNINESRERIISQQKFTVQ